MKVICAYCKKIIKEDDGKGGRDSHGMCEECAKEQNDILDKLEKDKLEKAPETPKDG